MSLKSELPNLVMFVEVEKKGMHSDGLKWVRGQCKLAYDFFGKRELEGTGKDGCPADSPGVDLGICKMQSFRAVGGSHYDIVLLLVSGSWKMCVSKELLILS